MTQSSHSPFGQALALMALGGLLISSVSAIRRVHARRHQTRPAALPERLQTWEGEGGRTDLDPESGTAGRSDDDVAPAGSAASAAG